MSVIARDDDFLKMRPLIPGYCHHLRAIGANNQSRGRDSYRRLGQGDADLCGRVHAWQELVIGVRDPRLRKQGARRWIEGIRGAGDQPGEFILWELPDSNLHLPPWFNRARKCLRDIDVDTERINPRYLKKPSASGRKPRASLRGPTAWNRRSRRGRAGRSADV